MNLNLSRDQVQSILRHVYTSAGTATAVLLAVGVISQGDATALANAVHQIGDGVSSIAAGVSALVPIGMGVWAAISASLGSRLQSIAKDPEVKQVVVATPAVADSVPSNKVVAQ